LAPNFTVDAYTAINSVNIHAIVILYCTHAVLISRGNNYGLLVSFYGTNQHVNNVIC